MMENRRNEIAQKAKHAKLNLKKGNVNRGNIYELMKDLDGD
jgi:hypothetical protein